MSVKDGGGKVVVGEGRVLKALRRGRIKTRMRMKKEREESCKNRAGSSKEKNENTE